MKALAVYADVANQAARPDGRRVAGMLDDRETVAIAVMKAGETVATTEFQFKLGDVAQLAEQCLAGNSRALTTPGLARILSASLAVLFRVAHAAGAFQQHGDFDGGDAGYLGDQPEAGGDEDHGD